MGRKTNALGIELIKKFEGFRADAYVCPAGVLTIGYGHTATAKAGQTIGVDTAERLLRADVEIAESAVERHIEVSLTDNQFAALVSFTFNLGAGSLKSSTLRKKLNIEEYDAVPSEMARWVRAGITKVYPPPCHQGNSPTLGVIIISSLSGFVGFGWENFSQPVASWEV